MNIDHPYHVDGRGRTAGASDDEHLRDLIEQVLFTSPGERVHRPTFGSGLLALVFQPLSDELAAATQFLVQGALEQWLGQRIAVESVRVTGEEGVLHVSVTFVVQRTGERREEHFERGAPS